MKIKDRLNSENKAIWDTIQYRYRNYIETEMNKRGDIIEIIGSISLQKNYKDDSRVDVNLFVEKVLGINNTDNSMFENDESDDYLDIKDGDLPF